MSENQAPLAMTLEEALAQLWGAGWFMRPAIYNGCAYEWIVYAREGSEIRHSFTNWPAAVSAALGRPVVARDEASELRAALAEAVDALNEALVYHGHATSHPIRQLMDNASAKGGNLLRRVAGKGEQ